MSTTVKSFISGITLLSLISGLPKLVSAHAHVTNIVINGQDLPGFPSDNPNSASPNTIAWKVNVPDNTFTRDYSGPDIICHKQAVNAKGSANIAAGGNVEFHWTNWPAHQGPVVDYMAACPGKCEDADKTQLKWFKIAEQGLISQTGCNEKGNTGCWALDSIRRDGGKWNVQIPSDLKAGNYVLRTEPINLDFPGQSQNYPACINLAVTGGGSRSPSGVVGTSLYTGQEPGLNFDIYNLKSANYPIPGPPIATGNGGNTGGSYTPPTSPGNFAASPEPAPSAPAPSAPAPSAPAPSAPAPSAPAPAASAAPPAPPAPPAAPAPPAPASQPASDNSSQSGGSTPIPKCESKAVGARKARRWVA